MLTLLVGRQRPSLVVLVVLSLVVLGFVAWLGATVVGTFLAPYAVTLHLGSSYGLLTLLLAQREIVGRVMDGPRPRVEKAVQWALAVLGLAFFTQWTLGIRVRDESEAWIWNHSLADSVFNALGGAYDLHKGTAVFVGATSAVLAWLGWRSRKEDRRIATLTLTIFVLVGLQAAIGLILWLGGLPDWAKPFHLLVATVAFTFWVAAVFHSVTSRKPSRV